jgi:hypothetical protein
MESYQKSQFRRIPNSPNATAMVSVQFGAVIPNPKFRLLVRVREVMPLRQWLTRGRWRDSMFGMQMGFGNCKESAGAIWAQSFQPNVQGFHPHPGGMVNNSPTFQSWVPAQKGPESRRDGRDRAVFRSSLRDYGQIKRLFPTLKSWAIVACPCGTGIRPWFTTGFCFANPSPASSKNGNSRWH